MVNSASLSPRSRSSSADTGSVRSMSVSTTSLGPLGSPVALSPTITILGSPRRSRASSCASSAIFHHRHVSYCIHAYPYWSRLTLVQRSPPRSPHETKILYEHALQKAVTETASVTDEIISRQSEILARKHDIAVWQVSFCKSMSLNFR